MSLLAISEWLEATWIGVLVRESLWGFPALVAIHIMALTLSVGTLIWFDLRLLGVCMRSVRISDMYRRLAPWLLTGFALMFLSGIALFIGFASAAYGNLYFRLKLLAIGLAAANALVYHFTTERSLARWDDAAKPPLGARLAGLTSILVWTMAILAGRMMSYTMF